MDLSVILDPIRDDLALVEREFARQVDSICARPTGGVVDLARRAVQHVLGSEGKRLRPILVLLSSRTADVEPDRDALVKVATAVELVHTASLVHDDIIDAASERRGRPSVNAAWGNRTAVLVGDLFYAQFFALLKDLRGIGHERQLALFDLFCDVTRRMCSAEILEDQVARNGETVSFETYLEIIEHKTASLMSAACESAAILTDAAATRRAALSGFGKALGMAYQLVDDLVDADASFVDREPTLAKARECGGAARDFADGLPPGSASRGLRGMSVYVMDKLDECERGAVVTVP